MTRVSGWSVIAAASIVSAAAVAAVALWVFGGRDSSSAASMTRTASTARVSRVAAHVQPAPRRSAKAQAPTTADSRFWNLIDETRHEAGNDTSQESNLLKDRLTRLSPRQIVAFARFRHRLDRQLYTWKIWGAATVIADGCSDDCFRDFRAYVISLGRGPYERALHNPDSLASVVQDEETGDWENADNVAPDAYSSVTGNDFPLDDSDLSGRPAGKALNLDNQASLNNRYPRLAARFRRA
jgi:hypothetical protein